MGVWIETSAGGESTPPPSVTPFVGVWIETYMYPFGYALRIVTPFVGVWIETKDRNEVRELLKSHPSWVCGLKLIKINLWLIKFCHTLRGCVD